jgi:hypothetical protein
MSPGTDSKESIPPAYVAYAGIFKKTIHGWARNRVGIGLSYRSAAGYTAWQNWFLGIDLLGFSKSLKMPALACRYDNPIPTWVLARIDCLKIPAQTTAETTQAYSIYTQQAICKCPYLKINI